MSMSAFSILLAGGGGGGGMEDVRKWYVLFYRKQIGEEKQFISGSPNLLALFTGVLYNRTSRAFKMSLQCHNRL